MATFECSISSVLPSVNFDSDVDLYPYFRDEGYAKFIPDFRLSPKAVPTDATIVYRNNSRENIRFSGTKVYVNYPWEMMNRGETLLYLGYPLIEAQHQAEGRSTIHSAAFSLNGRGVLFLGEAGCGKTSVVTRAIRDFDAELISNDLTIIGLEEGTIKAYGGTKFFHLRKDSVEMNMPWLIPFLTEGGDPWIDKSYLTAQEMGIKTHEGPVPLHQIYRLHIDGRRDSLTVKKLDGLQVRLFLNENLSRFIRNVTTAVLGSGYQFLAPVPSLDQPEFFNRRRDLIERMLYGVGVTYLAGPLDEVMAYISRSL